MISALERSRSGFMAPYPTRNAIEEKVLGFLPLEGMPVLNRVMLVRIRQTFEASVTQEDYFAAIDALENRRIIGRLRGAGGQVYRLTSPAARAAPVAERDLMAPTLAYLRHDFVGLLELPKTSFALVVDTSRMGPAKGTWARPDFVMVTVTAYALMPGRHVDVHSFELKNTKGGSVTSVHEALAQTRFTHYGHVIWHLPKGARQESALPEVLAQCDEHGIGFVRTYDPHDTLAGWEVLKTPRRKATHVGVVDAFLQERLSAFEREQILNAGIGESFGL